MSKKITLYFIFFKFENRNPIWITCSFSSDGQETAECRATSCTGFYPLNMDFWSETSQ